jgi:hypothetical protein
VGPDVRLLPNGFPVLETKLVPPPPRTGLLRRDALIDRLTGNSDVPVVAVLAPAGYGKSTLLAQWSESDPRHFAWLSIDERDNDPSVLLAYIAFALGGASSLGPDVAEALASPAPSVWAVAVPRLGAALAALSPPFVWSSTTSIVSPSPIQPTCSLRSRATFAADRSSCSRAERPAACRSRGSWPAGAGR